jgi:hypothetical protein
LGSSAHHSFGSSGSRHLNVRLQARERAALQPSFGSTATQLHLDDLQAVGSAHSIAIGAKRIDGGTVTPGIPSLGANELETCRRSMESAGRHLANLRHESLPDGTRSRCGPYAMKPPSSANRKQHSGQIGAALQLCYLLWAELNTGEDSAPEPLPPSALRPTQARSNPRFRASTEERTPMTI